MLQYAACLGTFVYTTHCHPHDMLPCSTVISGACDTSFQGLFLSQHDGWHYEFVALTAGGWTHLLQPCDEACDMVLHLLQADLHAMCDLVRLRYNLGVVWTNLFTDCCSHQA